MEYTDGVVAQYARLLFACSHINSTNPEDGHQMQLCI